MKLHDLIGFAVFYTEVKEQKLPIKTSYELYKVARTAEKETQFYKEELNKIITGYAELDGEGKPKYMDDGARILIKPGFEEECMNKIQELDDTECDIEASFSLSDFDGISLTMEAMQGIAPFLKD